MPYPTPFSPLSTTFHQRHLPFPRTARRASLSARTPSELASASPLPPAVHPPTSTTTCSTTVNQQPSSSSHLPQLSSSVSVSAAPTSSHPPTDAHRLSRRLSILSRNHSFTRDSESSSSLVAAAAAAAAAGSTTASRSASRTPSLASLAHSSPLVNAELRPRDNSEDPASLPVEVPPQTQKKPNPAHLSHALSTPPHTAGAPHLQTTAVRPADINPPPHDKRRKLVRSSSKLESRNPLAQTRTLPAEVDNKMHQTSSRLLRMTDDERPFTRDFKDLFSTLMVSLPLTPHRVRFQRIDHTFTTEEAITNLGSLKFSQSNRMPDPKDPSRIVTTTTTTTFSMAKEMAKSVCTKFLDARFIETVDGKVDFTSKSSVWQLTPKGIHILERFCQRNGIQQDHVQRLLRSDRNTMRLVILEREAETDKLNHDQATVEVIFRRFAGGKPNIKAEGVFSDNDSVSDYSSGQVGVKVMVDRKIGDRVYKYTFTGKSATDWLMDCCTMVDRRESYEIAQYFVEFGLIAPLESFGANGRFQSSKGTLYYVTEHGQRVAGWSASPQGSINGDSNASANGNTAATNGAANRPRDGAGRDSNANRMSVIIRDPALRLLFREFLRDHHCEENLSFYLDVKEFLDAYNKAKSNASNSSPKLEIIRETLAAAYSLYNAFLAPGSPCELNIDHSLRIALAARMTRAVGEDEAMIKSLDEVATLFDQAQTSVFKLMASDSVPKFMKHPKFAPHLRERNLDLAVGNYTTAPSRN